MKKSLMFMATLAAIVLLAACKGESQQPAVADTQQQDSLQRIIAQKDNEINDMMETFNQIQDGLREVSEAENRVALAKAGEGSNRKGQIMESIRFISNRMEQNRKLINKLRQQLRESSVKGEELKKTIDELVKQLDEKEKDLQQLREELDAKDIHIGQLDETIANLNDNVTELRQESTQKTNTIKAQDKQLHTAWFVFGTKSELKEQHILENGKVLESNFNKSYFTKIDIRVMKEIKLYSKSAKLLTMHPSGSYTLERNANKQYVLRITNPDIFWSTSKYLVVLVK